MFSFVAEHMQKLVAMGAAVTGVVVCLPQTIFLERYKNVVHVYEKGEKASLDEETVELTDMVCLNNKLMQIIMINRILIMRFPRN